MKRVLKKNRHYFTVFFMFTYENDCTMQERPEGRSPAGSDWRRSNQQVT